MDECNFILRFPCFKFQKKSSKDASGFTLLELMVALAIVIILATMSIPSLRSILTDSRIKAAADTFVQQIQLARSEAIQRQQNAYLTVTSGSNWCSGVNANTSCSCSPSNNCSLNFINYTDYSGVSVSISSGFTGGGINFDSTRGFPNEAAQLVFQGDSKSITVSINAVGQITVCSTNVTGYPAC